MRISQSTPNFKSRNLDIRQADKICRMVNREFPSISPSMVVSKASVNLNVKGFYLGKRLQKNLENNIRNIQWKLRGYGVEYYKTVLDAIKENKLANCVEKARIANLIAQVSGYKSRIASLIAQKKGGVPEDIDHAVVVLTNSKTIFDKIDDLKRIIVIDPWLGIADYGSNIALRYKNQYSKILDISKDSKIYLNYGIGISESETKALREAFPQFIIDKK